MAILTQKPTEWTRYSRTLPVGFRAITDKEALADVNILARAREFINRNVKNNAPIGAQEQYDIGGYRLLFIVEPHYHEPNGPAKPWGWHKGCTVFIGPKLAATVPDTYTRNPMQLARDISKNTNIKG